MATHFSMLAWEIRDPLSNSRGQRGSLPQTRLRPESFQQGPVHGPAALSPEIKRHLLLGRKAMTNLDSILKSRNITLPTYQESAEVNKRSARDGRLQSRGPSYFHLWSAPLRCAHWMRSLGTQECQCKGHSFSPWPRKVPRATGQLSVCATTKTQ